MKGPHVLIAGGAIMGSATAWFLSGMKEFQGRITVVEPEPGFARSATALSASGLRAQFSHPVNVEIGRFGAAFLKAAGRNFGQSLLFRENGYLYLAEDDGTAEVLRRDQAMQAALGAGTVLLQPAALSSRFPHLRTEGLILASYGIRDEGWFDAMGLLAAFRAAFPARGVASVRDRVTGLDIRGGKIRAVLMESGEVLPCDWFVNTAGTEAPALAALAGAELPVRRRKRTNFFFRTSAKLPGDLPLTIEPGGVWYRPEGDGFICGCSPAEDPDADPDDFEPRHQEFDAMIWPVLAARSPAFEALKMTRFWAGHYDMNIRDQNAILGPLPGVPNMLVASGFSGHGVQQAPAVGRGLAEWIALGHYASLDLSPLGSGRLSGTSRETEKNVI